jgi:hypothetical protein
MDARSVSSESCTAWRSESETTEMSSPSPSEATRRSATTMAISAMEPSIGTPRTATSSAMEIAAMAPPSRPNARTLPITTSVARIGDDRNRSSAPLLRSLTIDKAMRVTAICWSTSASAAGP